MADDFDEDIFDDLYDEEPKAAPASSAPAVKAEPEPESAPAPAIVKSEPDEELAQDAEMADQAKVEPGYGDAGAHGNDDCSFPNSQSQQQANGANSHGDDGYGLINVKEDGPFFYRVHVRSPARASCLHAIVRPSTHHCVSAWTEELSKSYTGVGNEKREESSLSGLRCYI
ncbi:hypothetical protein CC80DRAFT_498821 [Byssothecium circinans]|uniref:Uncharacterized protein n=1 Tax=Byssothecium circinans TaxID=147558 RepID=A0A6A5UI95_9PLEO|nr:hypothetical protein CC80DRAFT_498821 [Byssothecium circinans]